MTKNRMTKKKKSTLGPQVFGDEVSNRIHWGSGGEEYKTTGRRVFGEGGLNIVPQACGGGEFKTDLQACGGGEFKTVHPVFGEGI